MMTLVFDIETIADESAVPFLEPPEAPANYKDATKIAAYIADKEQEQRQAMALDPDLCRIVAWGMMVDGANSVFTVEQPDHEAPLLEDFWHAWRSASTRIGYNCLGFDLPVLIRRSQLLGVKHPSVSLNKYRSFDVIDLMNVLSFEGARKFRSLTWYAKRFGLDVPVDPVSGKDIGGLVKAGDWEAVRNHCAADVATTAALAKRLGVLV